MAIMSSRSKQGSNISYISKKRICITVTSHVNSSKLNNPNTYNSDNVIKHSNIPLINIHTKCSSNELNTLQNKTDADSSTSINEENIDDKNASE